MSRMPHTFSNLFPLFPPKKIASSAFVSAVSMQMCPTSVSCPSAFYLIAYESCLEFHPRSTFASLLHSKLMTCSKCFAYEQENVTRNIVHSSGVYCIDFVVNYELEPEHHSSKYVYTVYIYIFFSFWTRSTLSVRFTRLANTSTPR